LGIEDVLLSLFQWFNHYPKYFAVISCISHQMKKDITLNPYKMSSFINLGTLAEESENAALKDSKHFERWSKALGTVSILVSILVKLRLKCYNYMK